MANPINASEIWDNPSLQNSIVKYRQLTNCRNDHQSSQRMAIILTGFIIFTVCVVALKYVINAPEWSILLAIASIIFVPCLIAVLVSLPGQRSTLSKMEEDFSSEKAFADLIEWFSHASIEDLKDYNAYAPGNVYHTFFDQYHIAKQRATHVNH